METAGVTAGGSRAAEVVWCVVVVLLVGGSSGSVCDTTVESLDLGCLLRWTCPRASPNTSYSVQTKTQGGPWLDVSWCVWVRSRSCDVSRAFSDFELYNMIRLGVHLDPGSGSGSGSTVWIRPRKFDYSDLRFSPPSVSVSLRDEQLSVAVRFPCAASRRCPPESCCPVSELIDPWTTVTVYNGRNRSEYQSRTVWTQEVSVSSVQFSGLSPGQNYCAVANFSFPTFSMAASPRSAPQCVEVVLRSGVFQTALTAERGLVPPSVPILIKGPMPVLGLGLLLASLLIVPLLVALLKNPPRAAAAAPPAGIGPKAPTSPRDPVYLVPLSLVPVDLCDIHVELVSVESSSSTGASDLDRPPALRPDSGGGMEPELGPRRPACGSLL